MGQSNSQFDKKIQDARYGQAQLLKKDGTTYVYKQFLIADESLHKNWVEKRKIEHPNLIKIVESGITQQQELCSHYKFIYWVMEYIPISLHKEITVRSQNAQHFTEQEIISMLSGLVDLLAVMQSKNIAHQNIRPLTISYNKGTLKLCDNTFNNIAFQNAFTNEETAKLCDLSPILLQAIQEQNSQPKHNIYKSDVFSLGMCMLQAAVLNNCRDCYDFNSGKVNVDAETQLMSGNYSTRLESIISAMLELEEEDRPDFKQLQQLILQPSEIQQYDSHRPQQMRDMRDNKITEEFLLNQSSQSRVSSIHQNSRLAASLQQQPSPPTLSEDKSDVIVNAANEIQQPSSTKPDVSNKESTNISNHQIKLQLKQQSKKAEQQLQQQQLAVSQQSKKILSVYHYQVSLSGAKNTPQTIQPKVDEFITSRNRYEEESKIARTLTYEPIPQPYSTYTIQPTTNIVQTKSVVRTDNQYRATDSRVNQDYPYSSHYQSVTMPQYKESDIIVRNSQTKSSQLHQGKYQYLNDPPAIKSVVQQSAQSNSFMDTDKYRSDFMKYQDSSQSNNNVLIQQEVSSFINNNNQPSSQSQLSYRTQQQQVSQYQPQIPQQPQPPQYNTVTTNNIGTADFRLNNFDSIDWSFQDQYKPNQTKSIRKTEQYNTTLGKDSDQQSIKKVLDGIDFPKQQDGMQLHITQQQFTNNIALPQTIESFSQVGRSSKANVEFRKEMEDIVQKNKKRVFKTEVYGDKSKYKGEQSDGMRDGYGKLEFGDGGYYEGEWSQDKMHGFGTLYYQPNQKAYEGHFANDKFTGFGTLYNKNPVKLNGNFDYSDFNRIENYWSKYVGNFKNDLKHGSGILYITNGEKYQGEFMDDNIHGHGQFGEYSGEWIRNRLSMK